MLTVPITIEDIEAEVDRTRVFAGLDAVQDMIQIADRLIAAHKALVEENVALRQSMTRMQPILDPVNGARP